VIPVYSAVFPIEAVADFREKHGSSLSTPSAASAQDATTALGIREHSPGPQVIMQYGGG
jgi:hypothetical protein